MNRYEIEIPHLDLEQMYCSGQQFSWEKIDNSKYSICHRHHYCIVEQVGDKIIIYTNNPMSVWQDYFATYGNFVYCEIYELCISSDNEFIRAAAKNMNGIRILNQDIWEVWITFMISQNNNMKRIQKSVDMLKDKCNTYYFPNFNQLQSLSLEELKECGLGYRAEYIYDLVHVTFRRSFDFTHCLCGLTINSVDSTTEELIQSLMTFKGIGRKVASCIALYGFHRLDCAPIDTHMKQIIETYFDGDYEHSIFAEHPECAGVIQQICFDYKTQCSIK